MLSLPLPNPDDFKVDPKEMEALEIHAMSVMSEARDVALTIHNLESCNDAADWIRNKKQWIKDIETGWIGTMKKNLYSMWESAKDKEKELIEPVEAGVRLVNQSITEWNMTQERLRRQEQDRAIAEAKKRDEEDRLAQAQAHEAAGNPAMADAVLQGAGQFVAPIIPQEKPKGVIPRKYWKAEVTDKRQLLKFLAEKPGYENAFEVNTTWLATQAKQMDGNLNVPGVRFYQQDSTTIR